MHNLLRFIRNLPLRRVLANFYAAGFLLFALPFTRPLFIALTALSLFCVFMLVWVLNCDRRPIVIAWFIVVIISAFFLEWIGVASGTVFGHYAYHKALAPLLHGTPIVIGFNWLMLVYTSRAVVYGRMPFVQGAVARVLVAAGIMLVYDAVLEIAAPVMHMWSFDSAYPPLRNFVAWFLAAAFYHSGMEILHVDANPDTSVIIIAQWIFLSAIALFSIIVSL